MEDLIIYNNKPVFKNQPILCPWISCQPYPSLHQVIKSKRSEFAKKLALNGSATKKTAPIDPPSLQGCPTLAHNATSTQFFYFLRLMQLFPDTHPATLHTVLTLSKHNFFFAIDKLLYAQKCKSDFTRKLTGANTGRTRNNCGSSTRGRQSYTRINQRYQAVSRPPISTDLAEVQRIIDLAERPYCAGVQSVENILPNNEEQQMQNRVVKICVENPEQLVHMNGTQTFVETENGQEVIEIVCFDNDQTILKQNKGDDAMELESYAEQVDNIEPSIQSEGNVKMEEENEPPVIVLQESEDHTYGINEESSDNIVNSTSSVL